MKTIPSATFRAVLAYVVSLGHEEEDALYGTGIKPGSLDRDGAVVTPRAYRALARNGLRLTGQPWLGLSVGLHSRISDFGLFGYALMSCSTLGDAARLAIRYWSVTGAAVKVCAFEGEDHVTWRIEEAFPVGGLWVFACERWASAVVAGTRANTGERRLPHRLEFNYSPPAHSAKYAELLRCQPEFNRPFTQLSMPKAALAQPNLFSNREAAELCALRCEQLADKWDDASETVAALRTLLVRCAGNYPSLDGSAANLGMSGRSLRRRLAEAGLTYQRVLDDSRAELAGDYLRETSFSIEEIAGLLGFSEPTNFSKAFRKWTGMSASEFRASAYSEHGRTS